MESLTKYDIDLKNLTYQLESAWHFRRTMLQENAIDPEGVSHNVVEHIWNLTSKADDIGKMFWSGAQSAPSICPIPKSKRRKIGAADTGENI